MAATRANHGGNRMTEVEGQITEPYEPPRLIVLGSFAALTQGGTLPDLDGQGGTGDSDII